MCASKSGPEQPASVARRGAIQGSGPRQALELLEMEITATVSALNDYVYGCEKNDPADTKISSIIMRSTLG